MDAPLPGPDALIRPWRTATVVASLVAAIELVLLLIAAVLLLAKPLSHAMHRQAEAAAFKSPAKKATAVKPIPHVKPVAVKAKLPRSKTNVWVLNGNGRNGAAGAEASRLSSTGYRIRGTGNASRTDYATTVVMYRPGFRGEGLRLAHDLHLKAVGPLDGLKPAALHGAQLVVLLGAG
jgi:LytR cell envelope-related transcriptional attenuator